MRALKIARLMSYYKYPRTPHFAFSPGADEDDKIIKTLDELQGQDVVITEKRDGECTSLYRDYSHARSIDSANHPSRNWVKAFHGSFAHLIPEGWRVCGENLFAKHSIHYTDLTSYFEGFSIWDGRNVALAWDVTLSWFKELGITPVPTLYRGKFDVAVVKSLIKKLDLEKQEGLVVRTVRELQFDTFERRVVKWVRENHVQTSEHWMKQALVPNVLRKS